MTVTHDQTGETAAAVNSEKHSLHKSLKGKEAGLGLVALSSLLRLIGARVKIEKDKISLSLDEAMKIKSTPFI